MKDWQHGYALSYLKELEAMFLDRNAAMSSPFAQMKKHNIAAALAKKEIEITNNAAIVCKRVQTQKASLNMIPGVAIAGKRRGDLNVVAIAASSNWGSKTILVELMNEWRDTWMITPAGYEFGNATALNAGFKHVGVKMNSFADVSNVYLKGDGLLLPIRPIDKVSLKRARVKRFRPSLTTWIRRTMEDGTLSSLYANHYSNYNEKRAWSGLSIRGFGRKAHMIEKPEEMSPSWRQKHEGEDLSLGPTELWEKFSPWIQNILDQIPGEKERVRLLRLAPGRLGLHTDQSDVGVGTRNKMVMRLHVPIVTTPDVTVYSYDDMGDEHGEHMQVGELWYLDIRRPHRVDNNGDSDRIHLVIDCFANDELRALLE